MATDSGLSELQEYERKGLTARQQFEADWLLNLAYFQGNQWSATTRAGRLIEPRLDKRRVRFTDNRVIGIVRTEIAKLTKQRPVPVVTPHTADDADVAAAQLAELVAEAKWDDLRLQRKLRSALLWARICTAGFWKIYWDSKVGDKMTVLASMNEDGSPGDPLRGASGRLLRPDDPSVQEVMGQMPDEMRGTVAERDIHKGEICVEVRSPWEIVPDPLAEEGGLEEAEWLVEKSVRSKDYVQSRYNKDIEPNASAIAGVAESRMAHQSGQGGSHAYKGVEIAEFWHRPSSSFPNGKLAVWAGETLLKEDDNPYGNLPYVMFTGIPVPGRFWPTSTVEQVRPVQTELNKTRSQIRENAARFGNPSLLKNKLSNVEWSGLPGEEVLYDGTMPESVPQFLRPPEMPAYVQADIDRMENSLQEISAQREISKGVVPTGVTAASAINLLQEADETQLANDVADLELTLGEALSMVLEQAAQNYSDERMIRITGEDGALDTQSFRGKMLKGHTTVEMQVGSGIPRSKAAKQAAMQEVLGLAIQYGVDLKPRDLRKFFRDYEVGGLERMFAGLEADERQITAENRQVAQGEDLGINSYDNDELHIEGHEEFQKSAQYGRLDPQIKLLMEKHVGLHRDRFTQQQEAAAAAQMQDPNAAPPGMGPDNGSGQPPSGSSTTTGSVRRPTQNGAQPNGSEAIGG